MKITGCKAKIQKYTNISDEIKRIISDLVSNRSNIGPLSFYTIKEKALNALELYHSSLVDAFWSCKEHNFYSTKFIIESIIICIIYSKGANNTPNTEPLCSSSDISFHRPSHKSSVKFFDYPLKSNHPPPSQDTKYLVLKYEKNNNCVILKYVIIKINKIKNKYEEAFVKAGLRSWAEATDMYKNWVRLFGHRSSPRLVRDKSWVEFALYKSSLELYLTELYLAEYRTEYQSDLILWCTSTGIVEKSIYIYKCFYNILYYIFYIIRIFILEIIKSKLYNGIKNRSYIIESGIKAFLIDIARNRKPLLTKRIYFKNFLLNIFDKKQKKIVAHLCLSAMIFICDLTDHCFSWSTNVGRRKSLYCC